MNQTLSAPIESTPSGPAAESSEHDTRSRLGRVLRLSGAAIIVAAGVSFLAQGFSGWNSVERIVAFLIFSLSLTGTGMVCGVHLRDPRGARVAVGLAALMIPALMCQLGGLIYSLVYAPPRTFDFLIYTARSVGEVAIVGMIVFAAAAGIAHLAFSVLARPAAQLLTGLYLALNALLLLPMREGGFVVTVTAFVVGCLMYVELSRFSKRGDLQTTEGALSRLMLVVPILVLLGRTICLYAANDFVHAAVALFIGAALFFVAPRGSIDPDLASISRTLGSISLSAAWLYLYSGVVDRAVRVFHYPGQSEYTAVCTSGSICLDPATYTAMQYMPVAALLCVLSLLVPNGGKGYRTNGALIALLTACTVCFSNIGATIQGPTLAASIISLFAGIALLVLGTTKGEKAPFAVGVLTVGVSLLSHLSIALRLYAINPWITLSVLGLATLIGSSFIESRFPQIAAQLALVKRLVHRLR